MLYSTKAMFPIEENCNHANVNVCLQGLDLKSSQAVDIVYVNFNNELTSRGQELASRGSLLQYAV